MSTTVFTSLMSAATCEMQMRHYLRMMAIEARHEALTGRRQGWVAFHQAHAISFASKPAFDAKYGED